MPARRHIFGKSYVSLLRLRRTKGPSTHTGSRESACVGRLFTFASVVRQLATRRRWRSQGRPPSCCERPSRASLWVSRSAGKLKRSVGKLGVAVRLRNVYSALLRAVTIYLLTRAGLKPVSRSTIRSTTAPRQPTNRLHQPTSLFSCHPDGRQANDCH